MSQYADFVDMEMDDTGVYTARPNVTGPGESRGASGRTPFTDPASTGLSDLYDLIGEILTDVSEGNRGRVFAEALIIAGVVPNPSALRQIASQNRSIEAFMQEVDLRAVVNLIGSKSQKSVDETFQTAAQYAATFAAGFGMKYIIDKLRG